MTADPPDALSEPDCRAVREQLARIAESKPFQQSRRRQSFLQYIVEEALAGRGSRLKGYTIAVEVFGRPSSFDPLVDPVVRIEAARLRDKLREYYDTEGKTDAVRIELPKGSYAPQITVRGDAVALDLADAAATTDAPTPAVTAARSVRAVRSLREPQSVLLALTALAIAAAGFWMAGMLPARHAPLDKPGIAVLPFDNIGRDARWQRFADGITEDIITDLSHSKDLIVIARNSAQVYKGKPADVRQVGRDLNVRYVLEGSIQPIGERIRVTAQLIDAVSGGHVWAERFDRPANDLFAVQSELTQRIAATLGGYEGAVADAERRLVRRKPPASLTAFETYLLAMEAKHRVTKDSLNEAKALFHKALERDPQLARAYVGLVDTQFYLIDLGLVSDVETAISEMREAGEKAVALDPEDGKTHYAFGLALLYLGKPEQAAPQFARAEALAPSDADLLLSIAWSLPALGQSQRAVALAERALTLNPHYPDWYDQGLSYVFYFSGDYARSVRHRLLVKTPLAVDFAYLAAAYGQLARAHEAGAAAGHVKRLDPAWTAERYLSESGGYPDREAELFIDGVRKAGLPDCVTAADLRAQPKFVRVRSCDATRLRQNSRLGADQGVQ